MYEPSFEFYDKNLLYDVKQGNANVHDFFRLLALCHTVMTDNKDDGKCITFQNFEFFLQMALFFYNFEAFTTVGTFQNFEFYTVGFLDF